MQFHLYLRVDADAVRPSRRLGASRDAVAEAAARRFRHMTPVLGTGPELVDHFGRLWDQGIERVYAWFSDFAPPDTLAAFGTEVIGPLSAAVLPRRRPP